MTRRTWTANVLGAALLLPVLLTLQGCFLPRYPGCGADFENRPSGDDMVVSLVLASKEQGYNQAAGLSVDAEGHSEFVAEYTVWALSPPVLCNEIPQGEVEQIATAWDQVDAVPLEAWGERPTPYLAVAFRPGGDEERYVVMPASEEENPALLEAARLTVGVFVEAYGDRLVRELRYAGLESLLGPPAYPSE